MPQASCQWDSPKLPESSKTLEEHLLRSFGKKYLSLETAFKVALAFWYLEGDF